MTGTRPDLLSGTRRASVTASDRAEIAALMAQRGRDDRPVPRYIVRHGAVMVPGAWSWVGPPRTFVAEGATGRNVTAQILDPFLPAGSRFRGRRYVSPEQARVLCVIACNPDGTRVLQANLMEKLERAG